MAGQDGQVTSAPRPISPSSRPSDGSGISRPLSTICRLPGELTRDIVIGLSEASLPLNKLPGATRKFGFSIGFKQAGEIMVNKCVQNIKHPIKVGDVIGCGVNYKNQSLFFTIGRNLLLGGLIRSRQQCQGPTGASVPDDRDRGQKFEHKFQLRQPAIPLYYRHMRRAAPDQF